MKLVYDNIVFDIQRYGGISVVWQELLSRMSKQIQEIAYIDGCRSTNHSRGKLTILDSSVMQQIKYPRLSRYFPVKLQLDYPFIFHSSYYRYCSNPKALNITTVHDFTYELFVKGLKQKIHTWQKFSAIRHSAAVVCISENTKRDLLKFLPDIDEGKIKVIYNGVSDVFHVIDDPLDESELPFPTHSYVVFIGRRDFYKNFDLTVKGVAATKYNLLIIGSQLNDQERKIVEQYLPSSRYKCLSRVSDECLNLYYNYAAALVYPSSYEGFGLPVLEAQRAGCPVIALNTSSIPEIMGDSPLMMREPNVKELVQRLRLLSNPTIVKQVHDDGLVNVQRFSWDNMAKQYLRLYEELLPSCK